ncbi:MAG: phosphoribosylformylglycinamidine synthase subunit PurL [Chloroflexota bacterium]|nr:phosphoribosylformylglycinamidine synthase subunit PurL [Chloroflexota bacterium]
MKQSTIIDQMLDELAISVDEYNQIVTRLGREPNKLELGLFGSLWSEHCGYKHSKKLLRMFAADSPRLLVKPGEENAGVVDIGDGLAVAMKIESHNHPSAIEPYQGAATGVGGIVRDIFAMGARPIALLNSLHFGPLDEQINRHLCQGVVAGISGYGNCIGVPNVGGEIIFGGSYSGNPLVNAMCVGLLETESLVQSKSGDPGNLLMLVGADTGRDGIHGASGLASRTFEDDRELRPTVQVGNPFLEKVLIEACLEAVSNEHVIGVQDLGAAGLTSASVEIAAKEGRGIEIDVALIPRRDVGMEPYEVMLSESQERMLLVVEAGCEREITKIFEKWDLDSIVIGSVTDDGLAKIYDGEELCASVPVDILTDPPLYEYTGLKTNEMDELQRYPLAELQIRDLNAQNVLIDLLSSHTIASKRWVYRQYDHQVQTNTVEGPGGDAAVLRIKDTSKGIALTTDGNSRICFLDPFIGGMVAVAEACRNLACTGAEPIALTDCLNFGNPEKLDIYFQLEQCVKGMAEASKAFSAPVVSGNVSLYNESQNVAIYPTPVVGALGLLDDVNERVSTGFKKQGDVVVVLGMNSGSPDINSLAGSEYLELTHNLVAGQPHIDLDLEINLQKTCISLIKKEIISSAHDLSEGGLAVALSESCIEGNIGFEANLVIDERWDAFLFGEAQSRILISLPKEKFTEMENLCELRNLPYVQIGMVGGENIKIGDMIDLPVDVASETWLNALQRVVNS